MSHQQILADQAGVISRRQALLAGLDDNDLRRLLRRRDLVVLHKGVYLDHTGTPTWLQRAWAAVLFAESAALCGTSALRVVEGPGKRKDEVIHVAIGASRRIGAPSGVEIHRMIQLHERTSWNLSPPRLRYDEAVLDVAAAARTDIGAIGELAAACQSRRTTAVRLGDALAARSRSPRREFLSGVLTDVAEGACSVLEHGYLTRLERAHGLPRAERQVRATATTGVIYRDAAYEALYLELDGRLFHDSIGQWDIDLDRDLDAAVEGRVTLRIGYGQVFGRACATAWRVGTLLRQRGWDDLPSRCGRDCKL